MLIYIKFNVGQKPLLWLEHSFVKKLTSFKFVKLKIKRKCFFFRVEQIVIFWQFDLGYCLSIIITSILKIICILYFIPIKLTQSIDKNQLPLPQTLLTRFACC